MGFESHNDLTNSIIVLLLYTHRILKISLRLIRGASHHKFLTIFSSHHDVVTVYSLNFDCHFL